jgi:hypothetical protein
MTVRTLGSPITASSLAGLDVVTLIAYQPRSESEIQALETFNINGGGLLVAGLGWSWMISPMTELREMPGNRVLARTYLGFTEPSRAPAAIPVQASPPSISNAVHAYNHLRAAAPPTTAAGIADIRRIQAYVRDVIPLLTLPSQLKAALQQLMHATKNAYPSAAAPLDPVDRPFDTLGLMYAARRPFDPAQVAAHPAASDFPGAVAASAPRVQKYVSIDTRVPGWHSTELYAAPGETLGLLVAAHATAGGLRLRIGAHTDQLWDKGQKPPTPSHADDRWLRMPEISRSFPLDRALLQAGSDFGGLVYVMVPEGSSLGTVTVLITNAVEAPLYRLGVTNAQSWADIRNRPAPWGELAADNIVLTLESRLLRGVNDPAAITSRWRDVTVAQDELAQWPAGRRKRADRVVFDRQISIGFMHAGYPVMSPTGDFSPRPETPDYIEREVLAESSFTNPATEAMWGMFHELGHEHQDAAWTFDGTVEVTNNLFTMYTIESVTGFPKETGISNVSAAGQKTEMCRYFHPTVAFDPFPLPPGVVQGTTFAYWKHRPFLALAMYIQLMDRLAATRGGDPWAPYKRVFKDYIDRPISDYSDDAKRDQWLIRLSRAANANLGPYFQTWKIPTTLTARNAVSSLPAFSWQPPAQSSCP